jgi:hypothetical protein
MSDDTYPDPPIDANEGGQLLRVLRNWDEKHSAKAAILARMAKTEWQFAHGESEPEVGGENDFLEFVEKSIEMVDEAVENADLDNNE